VPAEDAPVVFIVDDDANVRRSIQDLLSSVALRSEAFVHRRRVMNKMKASLPALTQWPRSWASYRRPFSNAFLPVTRQ
jgi:hypothetical protein